MQSCGISCTAPPTRNPTRLNQANPGSRGKLWLLSNVNGFRQIRCRHVVVTVPITVLQRDDITFLPPLPPLKQQAIQRVKMSNAIKVLSHLVCIAKCVWMGLSMSVHMLEYSALALALSLCYPCMSFPSFGGFKQPQCLSEKRRTSSVGCYVPKLPRPAVNS